MASFSHAKLVALLKKKDIGHSAAAREMGLTTGQISSLQFSQALVESGRVNKAPSTDASVKKLRADGARFELISAQTGKSVNEVKEILGEGSISRGSTSGSGHKTASAGSKSKSKTKTASKAGTKRKSASSKAKSSSARPARRARTLAERRAARSGNPS
jgi:hypothetical protein